MKIWGEGKARRALLVVVIALSVALCAEAFPPMARAADSSAGSDGPPDYSKLAPLPTAKQVAPDPPARQKFDGIEGPEPGESRNLSDVEGAPVEQVDRRTATSKVFRLPNGDLRANIFNHPINYRDAKGAWTPIDDHIVPGDTPGTFRNKANAWTVSFADTTIGVTLTSAKTTIAYAPLDAANVAPVIGDDGVSVVYRNAWPNADLVYRVSSDKVGGRRCSDGAYDTNLVRLSRAAFRRK